MPVWVWTDGIRTDFGGAITLIATMARLSGESSVYQGGVFPFDFVDDLLLDTFRERSGVGSLVGDIIRSHLRANVVGFAFESSEHSEHELNVLSGDSLSIYAGAEISHAISGRLPSGDIFGVRDREDLLD